MSRTHRLPNIHPGEVLEEELLEPLGLTAYRLSKELRVPVTRIAEILQGDRPASLGPTNRAGSE